MSMGLRTIIRPQAAICPLKEDLSNIPAPGIRAPRLARSIAVPCCDKWRIGNYERRDIRKHRVIGRGSERQWLAGRMNIASPIRLRLAQARLPANAPEPVTVPRGRNRLIMLPPCTTRSHEKVQILLVSQIQPSIENIRLRMLIEHAQGGDESIQRFPAKGMLERKEGHPSAPHTPHVIGPWWCCAEKNAGSSPVSNGKPS
jgi:hypothetical protein